MDNWVDFGRARAGRGRQTGWTFTVSELVEMAKLGEQTLRTLRVPKFCIQRIMERAGEVKLAAPYRSKTANVL